MGRPIQKFDNVAARDSDFPWGRARNNDGSNNGTRFKEDTMGDIWNFWGKVFQVSGITPNGLPDSEYNGQQFFQAFRRATRPYWSYAVSMAQSSTNAPTVVIRENEFPTITWTRSSAGVYLGTLTSSTFLVTNQTSFHITLGQSNGLAFGRVSGLDTVTIESTDFTGANADDIISAASLEIRVYKTEGL